MNLTQNFELVWPKLKTFNNLEFSNDGTGELEKILAMLILGVGSFLSGMLPAVISERNRRRFPLTTSLMLCLGAGILLATALIHILPEVRKQMKSNWAEMALCGGFFCIYFIDEFIHYFFGDAIQHTHGVEDNIVSQNNYGALRTNESQPLLHESPQNSSTSHSHVHCNDEIVEDANARICHTSHTEPCSQSMTGTMGLCTALLFHSIIEGLAIGVQNSPTKVLFLLGAVACHKFVMGFCLGLVFRSNPQTSIKYHIIGVLAFALGAVCGIGLGMLLVDVPSTSAIPIIQGLAGGTLFYVTVCEVIPREKAKWHQNQSRKTAGFAQFLAVAIGFSIMAIINFYLDDDA